MWRAMKTLTKIAWTKWALLIAFLPTVVACKSKDKPAGDPPASTPKAAEPAAKVAPAAACAAGAVNPDNIGVCIKVPDGLKPNPDVGHAGNQKAAGWTGDGGASISVVVSEYSQVLWEQHTKDLMSGGGFGGKLVEQGKLGTDGVWGTFTADSGTMERKLFVARTHNDKIEVECMTQKSSMSNVGPKVDDVVAACKTMTLAP